MDADHVCGTRFEGELAHLTNPEIECDGRVIKFVICQNLCGRIGRMRPPNFCCQLQRNCSGGHSCMFGMATGPEVVLTVMEKLAIAKELDVAHSARLNPAFVSRFRRT